MQASIEDLLFHENVGQVHYMIFYSHNGYWKHNGGPIWQRFIFIEMQVQAVLN